MVEIALGVFGMLLAFTGLSLLLLAAYVKFDYQVEMTGLRAVAAKQGGGGRYLMSSTFGVFFAIVGISFCVMGGGPII